MSWRRLPSDGGGLRPVLALGLLLTLGGAAASLAASTESRSANLDGDPAFERVVPRLLCEASDGSLHAPQPACAADQFPRRRIEIENTCAGNPQVLAVSRLHDNVDRLRLVEADGATRRREIFFDMRSGATGRGGEVRLVRLGDERAGQCARVATLFRYPTRATLGRVPRGASEHDSWSSVLLPARGGVSRRIRLTETYVDRDDAFCCPSFERVTLFRYSRQRDRYVRGRTRVSRIKARGVRP